MKFKIKLSQLFFIVFFLIAFFVYMALYEQYKFSKNTLIQNYVNKDLLFASKIKEKFKNLLDMIEYSFRNADDDCIKKTEVLQLLYKNGDFNATKVAKILNETKSNSYGHYEVFVIGRNYKVIDASYKPDLGFDLGQFSVYKKILKDVFDKKKKMDISYPHIDYSSMNIKRYYLVRAPDGKVLLQLAYVIDIYPRLKKTVEFFKREIPELKNIDIYFVEKYLIYKISLKNRYFNKMPLTWALKMTKKNLKELFNYNDYGSTPLNVSKFVDEYFNKRDKFYFFKGNNLEIIELIKGFFNNSTDKMILKIEFDTTSLNKTLERIERRFFITLSVLTVVLFLIYKYLILGVSKNLQEIVEHMRKNTPIENTDSYILEISELKQFFNRFRNSLNQEILKNKELLEHNRRFIVDTIHQIKTPLSIITLNIDYLKNKVKDEVKEVLEEIESAAVILNHSYEDFSYISANGIVTYEAKDFIDLGNYVNQRAQFFDVVAKSNAKIIKLELQKGLKFKINNIELDRIIDNNLSNAIKYSTGKEIIISLKKENDKAVLRFYSYGEKIKNPKEVFNKNYREHSHKRGLGIGLNIVKEICEKYGIKYRVYYEDGKNVFEYVFDLKEES